MAVYLLKPDSSRFLPDDQLKVFLVHTTPGFIGMFMTGWLASSEVVESDGFSEWTDRSISKRLGYGVFWHVRCINPGLQGTGFR